MTPAATDELVIRRAEDEDGPGIVDVWLTSWRATFDFPPGAPDDQVRTWLTTELVPNHETWVAADPESEDRVVALMALSDTMVEQLYVARTGSVVAWVAASLRSPRSAAPTGSTCTASR